MKKLVALSAIGKDRPGIVAGLTKVLAGKGCSLEGSGMGLFNGEAAVLLRLEIPDSLDLKDLRLALEPVARGLEMVFSLREMGEGEVMGTAPLDHLYRLVLHQAENLEVLQRITEAAANHGLNVTDMKTRARVDGGRKVQVLEMVFAVPYPKAVHAFGEELDRLQGDLKLDLSFEPVDS